MPPKNKTHDAICIILDVGLTSSSSGFSDSAFTFASEWVQRKLYEEKTDCFGIVLIGTQSHDNPLGLEHVTIANYNNGLISLPDFELLKYLEKHVSAEKSDQKSNWLHGLQVAGHFLKQHFDLNPNGIETMKIAMISDLGCPLSKEDTKCFDEILETLKNDEISFVFIGPDWQETRDEPSETNGTSNDPNGSSDPSSSTSKNHPKPMTTEQNDNFELAKLLVASTDGYYVDINSAILYFTEKERRKKRPTPWKVDLEIGPDIIVNITGYIKVRHEAPKAWKNCTADDPDCEEISPDVTYVRNNEDQEVIEKEDCVEAYKYGSELITVSDADKENSYNGGPKSMKVVGFMERSNVPFDLLVGEGSMVFQSNEDDAHSISAVSVLLKMMLEDDLVMVVRKVYRAGSAPRIAILMPKEQKDEEGILHQVFSYIELPFMEDVRQFYFAPLTGKNGLKDEQLGVMDELIDSLLIDDDDQLNPQQKLNPYYQHLYQCLTFKALNPGRVLPQMPKNSATEILEQPKELEMKSKPILEKIAKLFKLEEVAKKRTKLTGEDIFGNFEKKSGPSDDSETASKRPKLDLSLTSAPNVDKVGTVNPSEDFLALLQSGLSFASIVVQLEDVIFRLFTESFEDSFIQKGIKALKTYRETSLQQKVSSHYNQFIRDIKETLQTMKKSQIWTQISNEHLGLIYEDSNSKVTENEAKEFLTFDVGKNKNSDENEQLNENELLDDL